jgi:IS30 family transposase
MDARFQEILDSLPPKRSRSRLEPYGELIEELRQRGTTYRKIAAILTERCQLQTSASTVHDFVRTPTKTPAKRGRTAVSRMRDSARRAPRLIRAQGNVQPPHDVQQRMAALKMRSAPAKPKPKEFQYDPEEPLHLPTKPGKTGSK